MIMDGWGGEFLPLLVLAKYCFSWHGLFVNEVRKVVGSNLTAPTINSSVFSFSPLEIPALTCAAKCSTSLILPGIRFGCLTAGPLPARLETALLPLAAPGEGGGGSFRQQISVAGRTGTHGKQRLVELALRLWT